MSEIPPEVLDAVRSAARFIIAGHVNPDADCLGSMAGLCRALRSAGRAADVALRADSVSRRLQFILDDAQIAPIAAPAATDVAVVLDTAKPQRVNLPDELGFFGGTGVINIDHHATNPQFGRWNWVAPRHSSTAEMVVELLRALSMEIDSTTATLLYAGIHADTLGFSLPTTTPAALAAAVHLAQRGARIGEVCERLHRSRSRGEFELLATIYRNTRISMDGRLAWSSATLAEMLAAGATPADIDDQVEVPRSIEGIAIAMLFTELEGGKVRVNFRGEGGMNVLALAEQFGGGGHFGSAGARFRGALTEVVERVVTGAADYIAQVDAAAKAR